MCSTAASSARPAQRIDQRSHVVGARMPAMDDEDGAPTLDLLGRTEVMRHDPAGAGGQAMLPRLGHEGRRLLKRTPFLLRDAIGMRGTAEQLEGGSSGDFGDDVVCYSERGTDDSQRK